MKQSPWFPASSTQQQPPQYDDYCSISQYAAGRGQKGIYGIYSAALVDSPL